VDPGNDFSEAMGESDTVLLEVFGREMSVGGKTIMAATDDDMYRERSSRSRSDYAEGVWTAGTLLICRFDDLGFRPERGSILEVNGKSWTVGDVSLGEGLLEIELEANET